MVSAAMIILCNMLDTKAVSLHTPLIKLCNMPDKTLSPSTPRWINFATCLTQKLPPPNPLIKLCNMPAKTLSHPTPLQWLYFATCLTKRCLLPLHFNDYTLQHAWQNAVALHTPLIKLCNMPDKTLSPPTPRWLAYSQMLWKRKRLCLCEPANNHWFSLFGWGSGRGRDRSIRIPHPVCTLQAFLGCLCLFCSCLLPPFLVFLLCF